MANIHPKRCVILLMLICLLLAPLPVTATSTAPAVQDLTATYDPQTQTVLLEWIAPDDGDYTYRVHRGIQHLGDTTSSTLLDTTPDVFSAYTVTTMQNGIEGDRAIVVVPTTVPPCAPVALIARDRVITVTTEDCMAANRACKPLLIQATPLEIKATPDCLAYARHWCPILMIELFPPGYKVREECMPTHLASGGTGYVFRVIF